MDILPSHSRAFWKFPSSLSKINTGLILEAVCKIDSAFHALALKIQSCAYCGAFTVRIWIFSCRFSRAIISGAFVPRFYVILMKHGQLWPPADYLWFKIKGFPACKLPASYSVFAKFRQCFIFLLQKMERICTVCPIMVPLIIHIGLFLNFLAIKNVILIESSMGASVELFVISFIPEVASNSHHIIKLKATLFC